MFSGYSAQEMEAQFPQIWHPASRRIPRTRDTATLPQNNDKYFEAKRIFRINRNFANYLFGWHI
jgi:hypothetical protein